MTEGNKQETEDFSLELTCLIMERFPTLVKGDAHAFGKTTAVLASNLGAIMGYLLFYAGRESFEEHIGMITDRIRETAEQVYEQTERLVKDYEESVKRAPKGMH